MLPTRRAVRSVPLPLLPTRGRPMQSIRSPRPLRISKGDLGRLRVQQAFIAQRALCPKLQLLRLELQQPIQQKLQMKHIVFDSWLASMALSTADQVRLWRMDRLPLLSKSVAALLLACWLW